MISAQTIKLAIHADVFARFPETQVACSLVEVVVRSGKEIKGAEAKFLSSYKQDVAKGLMQRGVTVENYCDVSVCRSWQQVYETFNVEGKKSTIETLISRAVSQQEKIKANKSVDLGKISNFVDLYNCVSLAEMTPMGALDASKIEGNISLRLGKEGEIFLGLGKDMKEESVTSDHIVYADDAKVLTWLWNYRDAAKACVPSKSEAGKPTYILLFADQAHKGEVEADVSSRPGSAEAAIKTANELVANIGGKILGTWNLSSDLPEVSIELMR